jgi:hypothetical protein
MARSRSRSGSSSTAAERLFLFWHQRLVLRSERLFSSSVSASSFCCSCAARSCVSARCSALRRARHRAAGRRRGALLEPRRSALACKKLAMRRIGVAACLARRLDERDDLAPRAGRARARARASARATSPVARLALARGLGVERRLVHRAGARGRPRARSARGRRGGRARTAGAGAAGSARCAAAHAASREQRVRRACLMRRASCVLAFCAGSGCGSARPGPRGSRSACVQLTYSFTIDSPGRCP